MKLPTKKITLVRDKGPKPRVAIIVSRFNEEICEGLLCGALDVLKAAGIADGERNIFRVPGAFEIPLAAKKIASTGKYDGIICLGAVIRGETPHFEYISQSVAGGITQTALECGLPMSFGVLTTDTEKQAHERSAPDEFNKGREAALTVLQMVDLLGGLASPPPTGKAGLEPPPQRPSGLLKKNARTRGT